MLEASIESKSYLGADCIRGFLQGAVLQGYEPTKLLRKAGLPQQMYYDPDARIDGVQLQRLLFAISQAMDNDFFLGFMARSNKRTLPVISLKDAAQCVTLEDNVRLAIEAAESHWADIHTDYIIDIKKRECTWSINYQLRKDVDARLFYWYRLTANYKSICGLIGKRIKLNRVCFTFPPPEPECSIDYAIFNGEVCFNQSVNGLVFDGKYLQMPQVNAGYRPGNPAISPVDWLLIPGWECSLVEQVQQIIYTSYQQGNWSPSMAAVAKQLSLSERTLRRQLAQSSESFRQLKARTRCEWAIKLLVTTNTPITEIVDKLGFSEPGAFTRAFLSWTQHSPSEYRARYPRHS